MIKHEIMALTTRIADVFRTRIVCVQRNQCVKSGSFADYKKCRNWLFQWLREIPKEKFSRSFCVIDALNFL